MAPLTSNPDYAICSTLNVKIAEPEGRIHRFYQVHEAKKLMDTIVFSLERPDITHAQGYDISAPFLAAVVPNAASPPGQAFPLQPLVSPCSGQQLHQRSDLIGPVSLPQPTVSPGSLAADLVGHGYQPGSLDCGWYPWHGEAVVLRDSRL